MSQAANDTKQAVERAADKAATKAKESGLFAGVENTTGVAFAAFAAVYVLFPMAIFPMTRANGQVPHAVDTFWRTFLPHAASVPKDRVIPALAAIYATFAYGITGAFSVAGQAMATKESPNLEHPRAGQRTLHGLPLRLKSAHDHLMENFPMWAVAAGLAQILAPKNPQIIAILGLSAMSKIMLHYPTYVLNIQPLRTLAHLTACAANTAALYALATGAK